MNKLTFLYDGGCPICLRETRFLKRKDINKNIYFVDINSEDYMPNNFQNISYKEAMANLHGILEDGSIIKGIDVLSYSYQLIGLGWVYYPAKIPIFSQLLKFIYSLWAKYRLKFTGRRNLDKLCNSSCES